MVNEIANAATSLVDSAVKKATKKIKQKNNMANANNGLNYAGAGLGMAAEAFQNAASMAEVPENDFQENIDSLNSTNFNAGSYDNLANLLNSTSLAKTDYTTSDVLGMSGGEAAGQILMNGIGGAASGLSAGGATPAGGIMAGVNAGLQMLSSGIGYAIRKGRAARQAQQLNYDAAAANQNAIAKMQNSAMDIGKNMRNMEQLNIAALGGPLNTEFTNGVRFITEGGSHEQNPLNGVPQGIAQDGLPNLVEEGEVIYNDYVFSKRLKVPEKDKEMLGLKKGKDYTYAEAATKIQEESEERPNDPISKDSLRIMMGRLQNSQEEYKAKQEQRDLKKAVNSMTPEELAMFMQQLGQPQQMQPMIGMQSMQPMQPTQGEVPMFADGGLLGYEFKRGGKTRKRRGGGKSRIATPTVVDPTIIPEEEELIKNPKILPVPVYTPTPITVADVIADLSEDGEIGKKLKAIRENPVVPIPTRNQMGFSGVQALRAAPIIGSLASTINSLFDKPNYSNIERAEKAMATVPRVSPGYIGQRLGYNPIDINYIATQQANQGIGARRALNEMGAINPAGVQQAVIANNYANQTALGEALMQANQLNRQNLAQALEFNRGTDAQNIGNNLNAALANQQRDLNEAQFLFQTGQLRDQELGRIQANRSNQLTNLYTNLGNLGTDILNREQAAAMAESYAIPYSDIMSLMKASTLTPYFFKNQTKKKGGKLNTKKGGKHA